MFAPINNGRYPTIRVNIGKGLFVLNERQSAGYLMRIAEYITEIEQRFLRADLSYGHGTDNPADDAWYLVLGSLNIGFDCDELELQRQLEPQELTLLEERVSQRVAEKVTVA